MSGRDMLEAIIRGEQDCDKLANLARGLLKRKTEQLRAALDGKVTEYHRFSLKQLLAQFDFLNRQIRELDDEIARRSAAMADAVRCLDTIPGIDEVAARSIIAEIGTNMEQFPTLHTVRRGLGCVQAMTRVPASVLAARHAKGVHG
jgi:transposase